MTDKIKSIRDLSFNDFFYTLGYKLSIIIYAHFLKLKFTKDFFPDLSDENLETAQNYINKIIEEHFSEKIEFIGNEVHVRRKAYEINCWLIENKSINPNMSNDLMNEFHKIITDLEIADQVTKFNIDKNRIRLMLGWRWRNK